MFIMLFIVFVVFFLNFFTNLVSYLFRPNNMLFLDIRFFLYSFILYAIWLCLIFIILQYDISLTCNVTIWIRTCPIMAFVISADITSKKHNSSPFETVEVIFVKWISMIVTLFSLRQEQTLHIFSNIFMFYFFICLLFTTSKLNLETFNIDKSHRFLLRILVIVDLCTQYFTKYIILHSVQAVW